MAKIFKANKKRLFLMILGAAVFALSFWLVQPAPKAEAISCSSGCDTKSSGECVWDWGQAANNTLQGRKTCAVGASYYDVWDLYDGWETSCNSDSGTKKCETGRCPSSTVNGATCTIIEPSGSIVTGGCSKNEITGKWDASTGENKCIQCSSGKETQIYGSVSSIGTIGGDNKFETACGNTIDPTCDEKIAGDNCGGTKTCNDSGKCVAASGSSCTAAAPTITAAPNSYNGPASTQTFSISAARKDSSGCVSKSIPLTVSCTAGNTPSWTSGSTLATAYNGIGTQTVDVAITASGSCTMTAKSPDDNTKSSSSTVNITVPSLACPKGSGAGSGTSFAVDFKQSTFTTSETFKISYMVPPEYEDGAICIYAPGASSSSYSKNETSTTVPKTNSNYNTNYTPTSTGIWKITINKSSSCSASSTCFATRTVTAPGAVCGNNIKEGTEICDGTDLVGKTCISLGYGAGTLSCKAGCTGFNTSACGSPCTPTGAGCSQPADCCSGNCSGGTCVVAASATVNFSNNCYQLTGLSVSATINYSGVTLPAIVEIKALPPSTGTYICAPLTTASGSISRNLTAIGNWRADISASNDCWSPVGALQASSIPLATVQATACSGVVVPPPASSCSGPGFYKSPITFCNVQELITGATGWILGLVASVIILILVYGGIMYTTSAGDEERIRSAKNTILYAIIGLGIILISYSIITEVKSIFKIP